MKVFILSIIVVIITINIAYAQHPHHFDPHFLGAVHAAPVLFKPRPYNFGYGFNDGHGTDKHREESGDDFGNKKGSYGYKDAYGIYRQVDYVADAHGFRAVVRTNEPGTANQDPAHVGVMANPVSLIPFNHAHASPPLAAFQHIS
ncbi:adult-specific rigid cuticular protein 15.7-like protein, partial [Leptotrombidium deliense]